ncbi:hypothetical protein B0I31_10681 [Saccharothrix carnea]|uniref:MYXO-CTERM domain-containing protein n=1 Tax=Saccharothrix carnea TaxID=1280637 RepID=A0A2P8I805_SACCR|nr:hypothetical protein [Saccharothrix carnea]PSL54567.1 hypothetical protein B0I31_10681 [Saccharothrix carnea]
MWRSLFAVCLLALAGVFAVAGTGAAVTTSPHFAAQPTETLAPGGTIEPGGTVPPGPTIDAPQEPAPASSAETRRKLWIGGIAVLLFALVYWRNKKRWSKWKAGRKAK